jgi:hypothetical protein
MFESESAAGDWARAIDHRYGKELRQGDRLVLCFTSRGEA